MAWPGTPSTTGAATLGNTVNTYFERLMLTWLKPNLRFYSFATKTPLPTGQGKSVVWNRMVRLTDGYRATEGYPISAVKTLSTNKVSALIETLTDAVTLSDLAQLTSSVDTDTYASAAMSQAAAETIDKFVFQALVADSVVRHYVKKLGSVIASNSAAVSATASLPRLALSDIRVASTYLRGKNVLPVDGQNLVGIVHPSQMADLYSDSGFTNWTQYTTPEKMFNFEVGKIFNVRIVESTLVPISSGSAQGVALSASSPSSVSTLAYGMTIFGDGAFGVTELDGGVKSYKIGGASKSDPTDLTTVYGYKVNIAAKVLNPSAITFIWNGVGDSISASSGMSVRRTQGVTCDTDQLLAW